jgi:hypothetical protein
MDRRTLLTTTGDERVLADDFEVSRLNVDCDVGVAFLLGEARK